MSNLTPTTDARFTADVLESDVPVVVDFTAAWCPPCRMMDPILGELAAERPDLRFVSLDVDENHETVARHGILSMPTFMVDGLVNDRMGSRDEIGTWVAEIGLA